MRRTNQFILRGDHAVLICPATKRQLPVGVLIDAARLPEVLSAGFWRVANFCHPPYAGRLYAYSTVPGTSTIVYLHRFLKATPKGLFTDHRNRRGTDNRDANLRNVTGTINQLNRSTRSCGRSGLRGVRWNGRSNTWIARVGNTRLGSFDDPQTAANVVQSHLRDLGVIGETVTWMCHDCKSSFGGLPVCPKCGHDVREGKRPVGGWRWRVTPIKGGIDELGS